MISLNDNRTALIDLPGTIQAIDDIDMLIEKYSFDNAQLVVAYCDFRGGGNELGTVQFDRGIIVNALHGQRQLLTDYLATLGILA